MAERVRVRYAPSPTGLPHIGNIRTALFNWLYARHTGGVFILRIEDTDVERSVPGAVEAIMDGLGKLGLDWDEGPEIGGAYGPYLQSQRLHHYEAHARKLVEAGNAYLCTCPPERLEQVRQEQQRRGVPPKYDRRCRNLGLSWETRKDPAQKTVVRFKTPLDGSTTFHDLVRGDITFEHATLDDFVLLKSDGYPTYHLANVVDDHLMEVTHVMRAEEWLPSTPRHVLLYGALGWKPPLFAHLSMILGPDRAKLSKRHGATSIVEYLDLGYLPEALVNFMALLGWSLDDKTDIISREDLVKHFSLERIVKNPAIFNIEKLQWMNGVYIRHFSLDEFVERAWPFLEQDLPAPVRRPLDKGYVRRALALVQERAKTLREVPELTAFFFEDELAYDSAMLVQKGVDSQLCARVLELGLQRVREVPEFIASHLESLLRPLAAELGLKAGQVFGLLRVAATGRTVSPPLFETMEVLGRERSLQRLERAREKLQGLS